MAMDSNKRFWMLRAALLLSALVWTAPVMAQSADDEEDDDAPRKMKEQFKQAGELFDTAKKVGPWEQQYQLVEEATDNIFTQQGWTGEPDQFARQVMREVGKAPPWDPQKRQEIFLDQLQQRYSFTHDQMKTFDTTFQREMMKMTMKHFKDVLPVALEVARARAANEPFTAEQVQQWTKKLRPMMDDAMEAMERVTGKVKQSMSADQRAQLDTDLKAFRKRHDDTKRMADKWAAGQWTPTDWGLQNDPAHAGEMAKYAESEHEKNRLVEKAILSKKPDDQSMARDESEWDKYVKWFCHNYQCDDRQRTMAKNILDSSKKEAIAFRNSRRDSLAGYEKLVKSAATSESRKKAQADLDAQLGPIKFTFERMKQRLEGEVLTTDQRHKYAPQTAKAGD
jgi:hypothetical protein